MPIIIDPSPTPARVQGNELLVDPQGRLLAQVNGATVWIYEADGSTPTTIYTDAAGTGTITQPLTSTYGLVTAPGGGNWWLNPGQYVRAATHPDGRVLAARQMDCPSATDSARLTAAERRLNTLPINVLDSLAPYADVKGDGTTDDSAALQVRHDLAETTGRSVYYPGRTTAYLAGNLQIASRAHVFGDFGATTIKLPASAPVATNATGASLGSFHRFIFTNKHGGSSGDQGLSIHDLTLDGNVANGNSADEFYFGIALYSVQDVTIERVKAQNLRGDGIYINWNGTVETTDVHIKTIILERVGEDAGPGNQRQGVSIVQCRRGSVRGVTGERVGSGTANAFLVDVEPNTTSDVVEDFTIEDIMGYDCLAGVQVTMPAGGSVRRVFIDKVSLRDGPTNTIQMVVGLTRADSIDVGSGIFTDTAPAQNRIIWQDESSGGVNRPTNLTVDATKVETQARAATTTVQANTRMAIITGSGPISTITATWAGHVVTFKLSGAVTFTDGSNLKLASSFTTGGADSTIQMICDGTNWYELSRSVN